MAEVPVEPPEPFQAIFRTMGDLNRDDVIDMKDMLILSQWFGKKSERYDLTGDGKVNTHDLLIVARNQGKTLQGEWDKIRQKEELEERLEETQYVPNLPWYVDWLRQQYQLGRRDLEAWVNYFGEYYSAQTEALQQLAGLPVTLPKAMREEQEAREAENRKATQELSKATLDDDYSKMPEDILELKSTWDEVSQRWQDDSIPLLTATRWVDYDGTPDDAMSGALKFQQAILANSQTIQTASTIHAALLPLTGTAMGSWQTFIEKYLGFPELHRRIAIMEFEHGLFPLLERHYNKLWTPNLPAYTDLINMRVKEKISQDDFTLAMEWQGYDKKWSDLIWDAHFIAPSLDDILTAWRRGLIKESTVDQLMILVDLDPFYKGVFDTRKYVDPSVRTARYMFETGAIDEDGVQDIIKRNGYTEKDTKALVDYTVRFQERRFRERYITALMTGAVYGVVDDEEITDEVEDLGYTERVGEVLLKIVALRRRILKERRPAPESKLLSLGDLKRAFLIGKIDEDKFRQEVLERGYQLEETELLITLMKDKISTEEAGGKARLTTSELLNAWRYDVIDEDALRERLLLRGLDLAEVDMILATKKKQWGIAS